MKLPACAPQVSGLRAAELVLVMGDAHVYADHVEPLQQQLKQQPFPFPVRGCLLGPVSVTCGLTLALCQAMCQSCGMNLHPFALASSLADSVLPGSHLMHRACAEHHG